MIAVGYRWSADTSLFSTGNVKYVGSTISRLENGVARPETLDSYATVDASLGHAWGTGAKVTRYAINLFDADYFTYENGPGALATLGDRREIGVQFDYMF